MEAYPVRVKTRTPTAGAYSVKVASLEPRAYRVKSPAHQDPQKHILLELKA
jgi:hypothetical protein